jgi:GrpB-like predicted nucleotidyltransferase (UPF0157 family)
MTDLVTIADYDPQWPILFESEKAAILSLIGHVVVAVEHVGSTAVPGLGAKPIIDIMVAVRYLADAQECVGPLQSIGYKYIPEHEASIPERRFFRKPPHGTRAFHLHMVKLTSDFWKRHLLFRDYLRTHRKEAQRYYQLKKELAAKFGLDRDAYTDAKASFIESVLCKARTDKSPNS